MSSMLTDQKPRTLPISVPQYRTLVEHGHFDGQGGQIQLVRGKIVQMNSQGSGHSDPIDELEAWSHEVAAREFRIRIEKPLELERLCSSPEPDIAWVTPGRYTKAHPNASQVHLLIEVSHTSQAFDHGEKLRLYAEAGIAEYWIVDVAGRNVDVMRNLIGDRYQIRTKHDTTTRLLRFADPKQLWTLRDCLSDELVNCRRRQRP
ncbi:MAG: Uma2 family endonuclease, partial [Planctomycetota bacterium]